MISFAAQQGLIVASTLFPHKSIHKGTWMAPCGTYVNQIDPVLVSQRFRSSVCDVRSFRGADCQSFHFRVVARRKTERVPRPDISKLKDREMLQEFKIEARIRFEALEDNEQGWKVMASILNGTAIDVLGERKRNRKNDWYDDECKHVGQLRNHLRQEWLNDRDSESKTHKHSQAIRLVNKTCRRKKREALNLLLTEIEEDRREHRMREQFQKVKAIKDGYQPRVETVKDKEGRILTREDQINQKWVEHYTILLNRPSPEQPNPAHSTWRKTE